MKRISIFELALLVSMIALLVISERSFAQNCWTLPSVTQSAMIANNTAAGGHLTQHISGETPPPHESQVNKTLFVNSGQYIDAVQQAIAAGRGQQECPAVPAQGQLSKRQTIRLAQPAPMYYCANDNNDGTCRISNPLNASQVWFVFSYNNGSWILNSAYPRE